MPSAQADIKAIIDFIYQQSVQNAESLYHDILDKIFSLHKFPERGQHLKEIQSQDIREIRLHKLRIIYRILPNKVQVLTIHHSSRLLSNNPNFKDLFD